MDECENSRSTSDAADAAVGCEAYETALACCPRFARAARPSCYEIESRPPRLVRDGREGSCGSGVQSRDRRTIQPSLRLLAAREAARPIQKHSGYFLHLLLHMRCVAGSHIMNK